MPQSFESLYPNTSRFVDSIGRIEIGYDEDSPLTSFIRAVDMGGMVREGENEYPTLDLAFADLEEGLSEWMKEVGI